MKLTKADRTRHVEAWRQSGKAVSRYSEEQGLSQSSLRYWIKKSAGPAVGFARVRRRPSSGSGAGVQDSGLRLRVGRAEVDVSPGFDELTLQRMVRVLVGEAVER
ncbi:MAG: hypothetical protein OER77_16935 [Myxococcales bacterium]|nr:hypothetical protein [Myxococcales bacterium]